MIGSFLVLSAAASVVSAADPCSQVCDEIPGACGPDGSRCVDKVCTDLFWYDGALCSSTVRDCPNRFPLMCKDARILMAEEDHLGVHAYRPHVVSEPPFAPGRSLGRRGFRHIDATTSLCSSVLQVVLHSRALRSAVVDALEFRGAGPAGDAAVFPSTVGLLNRMYGDDQAAASAEGPLDASEFKHAIEEFGALEGGDVDLPSRVLGVFMNDMAQVSESLSRALTLATRSSFGDWSVPRAAEFIPFPTSLSNESRWSIKHMMAVHFEASEGYMGRETRITQLPELLSMGIQRYPEGPTERVNAYVATPMEIDFAGIMAGGEAHRYRLVGIVREIGSRFVADYFDSDTNEWIHANDTHLHVIQGQPRNGGADAVMVFYERL